MKVGPGASATLATTGTAASYSNFSNLRPATNSAPWYAPIIGGAFESLRGVLGLSAGPYNGPYNPAVDDSEDNSSTQAKADETNRLMVIGIVAFGLGAIYFMANS